MRSVIIGGQSHVGMYLVPCVVEAGHEAVCVSRGQRELYQSHAAWRSVQGVMLDRSAVEVWGNTP